jgi:hypothetical protein
MCGVPPAFSADRPINTATSVPACWTALCPGSEIKKQFRYKQFQIRMSHVSWQTVLSSAPSGLIGFDRCTISVSSHEFDD